MGVKESLRRGNEMSPRHDELAFYQRDSWELSRLREWPLYPFFVEETVRRVPYWYREWNSAHMMLVFLLEGEMRYRCAGELFALVPGRLLVLPLGADYSFESEGGGGYHKIVLGFRGAHLGAVAGTLGLNHARLLGFPDGPAFAARCREVGALLRRQREEDIPALMGQAYELLNQVAQLSQDTPQKPRLLALAQARLESRLDEPLGMSQLASGLGVGGTTLNRLFRERLGTSPGQFRTLRRLERARELLENTSLSVKEIAAQVGYCNQFHFANEFRRLVGHAPSACRRKGSAL